MLGAGCGGGARTERDPDATAGTGASGGSPVGGVDGGGDLPGGTGGFATGGGTGGFTTGGGTGGFATGGGGTGGFATGGGGTGGFATGGGTGGFATGGGGTGGSTAQSLVVEEDDPALCGALGTVANARGGFRGAGYLDTEDLPGAGISWVVHATAAGQYELGWRYASDGATRQARLRIAHEHAQDVEFPPPEDGAWGDRVVTAPLTAGDNHVSLVAQEAVGLPDIDSLTVYGAGVTAATCLEYAPGADLIFSAPQFTEASVHDPSVVKTGDDFYVFGSHLAAAKTADLMNWVQVARDGVTAQNPLFEDVVAELTEAFTWSTVVGLWAADVRQLRSTGRFLMYYNSCEGSSPLSAMGIASAASIEGPYTNEGVFLRSGGPGYDASTLPNAIDPHVFYDDEDTLWMVYGSYSGGIYLMRLNPETGFPLAGQEYGTHLLGGNHIQIEGPFIQHGPERGYYYLFTSYGGLAAGDGYNIRVARSRTAAGPYLDHAGVDQATVRSRPFDASGVKLLGDHLWADTEGTQGYVSPGHNSSYYDEASGRYFLVFHARFPGRGNLHQIRVHQMYLNVDGWPVVAPLRYAPRGHGSTLSDAAVDYVGLGEVAGSYQFVNHGRDTSGVIKESVPATLNPDRTVGGALAGTWKYAGDSVLVLDVDGGSFRGVLSRQWNEHAREFQITFTGVDARGISLWGLRVGD